MDGSPSVGFKEAVTKAISNWKDCNSRSRRSEYWWCYLACILLEIPFSILYGIMNSISQNLGYVFFLVLMVVALCEFFVMFALVIRRLHDTGRSGWWILIGFVPAVGGIILLILMLLDSQRESNEYGPSPKYSSSSGGYSSSNMI